MVMSSTFGYDALRPEVRTGELVRVRPGAHVAAGDLDGADWERQRTMALASCVAVAQKFTTPFAFGYGTAATLYGWLDVMRDDRTHVVQAVNPGSGQPSDVVRHVSRDVGNESIAYVNGLPVTTVEQTIVDCARALAPDEALAAVDGAFRIEADMSKFRREESEARQTELRFRALDRLRALGPARGVRTARVILELADGFAANPAESRMRWIALRGGLPRPTCQYEIWVDDQQYFADAVWMCERHGRRRPVIAEFDGALKYGGGQGSQAVMREKVREDAIRRRHRAEFTRLTWSMLQRPEVAFRELLDAFPHGCVPVLEPRRELQMRPSPRPDRRSVARS